MIVERFRLAAFAASYSDVRIVPEGHHALLLDGQVDGGDREAVVRGADREPALLAELRREAEEAAVGPARDLEALADAQRAQVLLHRRVGEQLRHALDLHAVAVEDAGEGVAGGHGDRLDDGVRGRLEPGAQGDQRRGLCGNARRGVRRHAVGLHRPRPAARPAPRWPRRPARAPRAAARRRRGASWASSKKKAGGTIRSASVTTRGACSTVPVLAVVARIPPAAAEQHGRRPCRRDASGGAAPPRAAPRPPRAWPALRSGPGRGAVPDADRRGAAASTGVP